MAENETTHWLRPATEIETLFYELQEVGGLLVSTYGLTLRSTQPLKDQHVQQALVHLFRKVPTLRLCFKQREDVPWACDMNREQIDFKALDTSDQLKVQEELTNKQFNNSEGPLWCARLLQDDSCGGTTIPALEASFPHSRSLVLANHHGIADGTTNCRTVNYFLQILDDVLAGHPIDDTEQLGELASGEQTAALQAATEEEIKKEENLQETLQQFKKRHEGESIIRRAFHNEDDPNFITKIVSDTLDEETTTRFFRRCKEEGVSVNSGFSVVLNGSLVDLVREAGLELDNYPISQMHSVNMRRYWQGDVSRALGAHISVMEYKDTLTHQWRDNFWQQARELHTTIHEALKNYEPLRFWTYVFMSMEEGELEKMMQERPTMESDQCLANIGNLDRLIPTQGAHVRLGHVVRTTQCWQERVLHMFHSLHGCLLYNLCYADDFLSETQAHRYKELIFKNLEAIL